jgi:hypothetical protein
MRATTNQKRRGRLADLVRHQQRPTMTRCRASAQLQITSALQLLVFSGYVKIGTPKAIQLSALKGRGVEAFGRKCRTSKKGRQTVMAEARASRRRQQ